jgi:hypothetical protein
VRRKGVCRVLVDLEPGIQSVTTHAKLPRDLMTRLTTSNAARGRRHATRKRGMFWRWDWSQMLTGAVDLNFLRES